MALFAGWTAAAGPAAADSAALIWFWRVDFIDRDLLDGVSPTIIANAAPNPSGPSLVKLDVAPMVGSLLQENYFASTVKELRALFAFAARLIVHVDVKGHLNGGTVHGICR